MSDQDEGSALWKVVCLCLLSFVSFWCQSVVTEERLVPALNVISDYYNIPDDIAGATLMAAGASSPELLCTLVSLFITHSSLGLGTIVGSEIFNLLIICAGSVYASKVHDAPHEKYGSRYLVLDKVMVIREVMFYGLSIGMLYVALSTSGMVVVQDEEYGDYETERIIVSFWKACLVFGLYVVYVIFCANMSRIMSMLCSVRNSFSFGKSDEADQPTEREIDVSNVATPSSVHYMSFDDEDLHELPYIYNVTTEPAENYPQITGGRTHSTDDTDTLEITMDEGQHKKSYLAKAFKLIKPNHLLSRDEYPDEINEVFELSSDSNNEIGCFMWQRSVFYSKAFFGSHAFHLRWFTITPHRISSAPNREQPTKHAIVYPLFDEIHVDEKRLIINIVHPVKGKHDFTLMAPSKAIFDAVLSAFQVYVDTNETLRAQGVLEMEDELKEQDLNKRDIDADEHVTLIERPSNANVIETALWSSVLPLRYAMHYTLPDVRHLDSRGEMITSIGYAYISTIACLIWLILGSYTMVTSLESLAQRIGISNEVMGVTLSAAGTSLPAYIASRIAAERGFGNQAVANVFGSNTFNIAIGLGLPWAIYIAVNGLEPYQDLANEGILQSMVILAGTLILFLILMITSGFVLQKWHADLFVLLYSIYIMYAVMS